MKIFISYSTKDLDIVNLFAEHLRPFGEVTYWAEDKELGKEAWETIFSWIDSSDVVLALITGSTVARAMSVGQEIGRAKAQNKNIIPIVSSTVPTTELGFLSGTTYQVIDPSDPYAAVLEITKTIKRYNLVEKQNQNTALVLAGLAFFILIFSNK
ncbi:MAG: toll/interleukin-1 receptor domain-containing protein [Ignavibacteriae bacterium]|nr:toll/interleukin-1 receptor domain-containing protein [Ignavibacteriota bacterium]NOG99299.1 toll/interleukin-1 receptor domain-containing protein [Ignavibacteriota bacterium]